MAILPSTESVLWLWFCSGGLVARLVGLVGGPESEYHESLPSGIATVGTGESCVVTTTREGVLTTWNVGWIPGTLGGVDGVDGDVRDRDGAGTAGNDAKERGAKDAPSSLIDLLDVAILVGIGRVRPFTHGDRVPGVAGPCCLGTPAGGVGNDMSSKAVKLSEPLVALAEFSRPSLVLPRGRGGTSELLDRPCELPKCDCDALDDELSLGLNRASTDSRSTLEFVGSVSCALLSAVLIR